MSYVPNIPSEKVYLTHDGKHESGSSSSALVLIFLFSTLDAVSRKKKY